VMAGGFDIARPCLHELAAAGRIVEHLGVDHIAFPTWEPVGPLAAGTGADGPVDEATPDAHRSDTPRLRVVEEPGAD